MIIGKPRSTVPRRLMPAGVLLAIMLLTGSVHAALTHADLADPRTDAVLLLRCIHPDSGKPISSLGALLDTGATGPDLALVAAHGLGADPRYCTLRTGNSSRTEQLPIAAVYRGAGGGGQTDWAVLTLNGRFAVTTPRIPWHALGPAELRGLMNNTVHLIKFPNGETGAGCRVYQPDAGYADEDDKGRMVTGNCRTIPGMSGAPVIVKVNNAPTLVGLNIGHRFSLNHNRQAPPRLSVIRLLDEQIALTIEEAVEAAMQQAQAGSLK